MPVKVRCLFLSNTSSHMWMALSRLFLSNTSSHRQMALKGAHTYATVSTFICLWGYWHPKQGAKALCLDQDDQASSYVLTPCTARHPKQSCILKLGHRDGICQNAETVKSSDMNAVSKRNGLPRRLTQSWIARCDMTRTVPNTIIHCIYEAFMMTKAHSVRRFNDVSEVCQDLNLCGLNTSAATGKHTNKVLNEVIKVTRPITE